MLSTLYAFIFFIYPITIILGAIPYYTQPQFDQLSDRQVYGRALIWPFLMIKMVVDNLFRALKGTSQ